MKRIVLEDAKGDHLIMGRQDEPLKVVLMIPVAAPSQANGMDLLRFHLVKVRPKFALYREASAITPLPEGQLA